jgi:hypothetical protein
MRQKLAGFLAIIMVAMPLQAIASFNSSNAQTYLLAHSDNPWSTMGLVALSANNIPSDYLKTVTSNSAIGYTAPILALAALGKDPKTFGNQDYIAKLKSFHSNGQIGDASTLNDDIFGLLALRSANEPVTDPVIADAKQFLLSHQNSNGGWGFTTNGSSDSNMTATAILALLATGTASNDSHIQQGLTYLKTAQNDDGGFTYDPQSSFGTDSDSSSTAWVLWALNATGIDQASWSKNGNTPKAYLESNQTAAGYFKYQADSNEDAFSATTTGYAAIALAGKFLPVKTLSGTTNQPIFDFRIEGSSDTVCTGKAAGPTALDIVKNASNQCGFTFTIQSTSFGPYLEQINNDKAAGLLGWIYHVNFISPDVGAADYQLTTGDQVLWYYGDFNWKPTRLSVSPTTVSSGASTQATAEFFTNNSWSPLAEATINVGASQTTTDGGGKASVTASDGFYKLVAEKVGFVRSNRVLVKFGNPTTGNVSLSANVQAGAVAGDDDGGGDGGSISFIVDQSSIDFGTIQPGSTTTKEVALKNSGTSTIRVESNVEGDSLFKDNLLIGSGSWRSFGTTLNGGQNQITPLTLKVPNSYNETGNKSGQIIFWAMAQ